MKYSTTTGFPIDTTEEVVKLIDEVTEIKEIVKEVASKVKEQETEKVVKKETKEETKEQIPEELTVGELTVEENEDYLDVEELILYLVKKRKSKRLTELLLSELFKLIENKAGLQFKREDTDVIINNYISQIMFFSERLMDLSGEIQKLAKN